MYERTVTLTLVTNASAVANNLTIQFIPHTMKANAIAVIHEGYINVIPVHNADMKARYIPCVESGSRPRHVSTTVTQVLWCRWRKQQVFMVASSLGLQIYSDDGRVCKFSHPCTDMPEAGGNYARGLALVGEDMLCVGNTGSIRIFHASEASDEIEKIEMKRCHEQAITDMAGCIVEHLMVSADESGAVSLWTMKQNLQLISSFPTYGYPCTSVKLWRGHILCGYGSGHIRIFSVEYHSLTCEVAGHARWITAIDIAPETGYFLSTSEDSFAKVWQLSEDGKVSHKFSTQVQDCMLVGGRFLTMSGDMFCVSCYDSCDVICYAA
ncbi:hypothetical protein C0J52_25382 [Blattella germanica]|nr:hypothetical protein C0J52_25382 [Blattella germanica]